MRIEKTVLESKSITELQSLHFEAGAYFSSHLELKVDKSLMTFRRRPDYVLLNSDNTRTLSPEEVEGLIRVLNDVKVLDWKADYEDTHGVLDGFSWSLTLVYNQGKRIKTGGYVNTPENFGQLEEFLEKLAGDLPF